ncbi:MAG: acyl-[acyl-carrier-protein] thioesterase [Bacilli bacterium]
MDTLEITRDYWLTTGDFDENNQLKAYAVLDYFQDIASYHSWQLQAGYNHLLAQNKMWILIKNIFQVYEQPTFFQSIKITSWPLPVDKIYYPRAYQIKNKDGRIIGEGMSYWSIINLDTNMVSRQPWFLGDCFRTDMPCSFQKKIEDRTDALFLDHYVVRAFDVDHYHHMNNAVYANLVHLVVDKLGFLPITNLEIHYIRQAKLGETVFLYYLIDDEKIFVYGKDKDKKIIFSSQIKRT